MFENINKSNFVAKYLNENAYRTIEKNRIVSLPCPYKAKVVISFLGGIQFVFLISCTAYLIKYQLIHSYSFKMFFFLPECLCSGLGCQQIT